MKTILLTAAGGSGTLEIILSLKGKKGFRVVGLDASPYSRGLALCDTGYVVPFATDKHYKKVVIDILKKEKPDFIIPLIDEEILLFHDLLREWSAPAPILVAPQRAFCDMALDKWKTYQALKEYALPTPETFLATQVSASVYPAVIKPRDGRGSREVAYLKSAQDLNTFIRERTRPADHYIVQKQVFGKEFTVSAVVGLDGQILAIVPKEVVVKKGITQVGITRNHPAIERLCRDVQKHMHANGPFNVQLMLQNDQTPTIIEINPRYSTTVALTLASGINEVLLVIRHALGEKVKPQTFKPDLLMYRYQTQVFLPEKKWPPKHVAGRV